MSLILDIWRSFRALPLWVQIWVALILVPINLAGAAFWEEPVGKIGFVLGLLGMLPNLYFMVVKRGFRAKCVNVEAPEFANTFVQANAASRIQLEIDSR